MTRHDNDSHLEMYPASPQYNMPERLRPLATVDAVLMTIDSDRLCSLAMRRTDGPAEGEWALPGGYIRPGEDSSAESAIRRVLLAKTGFDPSWIEQLETFSGPTRDPRGWSLSVAWIALAPRSWFGDLSGPSGSMRLLPVDEPGPMAFDHQKIIAAAARRLRGKGSWSVLPGFLLEKTFTLAEFQSAYECVLGYTLDTSNFRRKVSDLGLLEPVGVDRTRMGRPAKLFRMASRENVTFDRMV